MTFPSIDTIATYGGELSDYGTAIVDATTDRSAANANKAYGSVAALTHCSPQFIVRFTGHATTPVLVSWEAAWKIGNAIPPILAHTGTGIYTVELQTTFTDELGDTQTTNLRWAIGSSISSTRYGVQCDVTAANIITVYTFNAGGTANDATVDHVIVGF
jgi:hypothetical protein